MKATTPSFSANKSQWQTAFNKISAKHFDDAFEEKNVVIRK